MCGWIFTTKMMFFGSEARMMFTRKFSQKSTTIIRRGFGPASHCLDDIFYIPFLISYRKLEAHTQDSAILEENCGLFSLCVIVGTMTLLYAVKR